MLECFDDDDCNGSSDTCVANICYCKSNIKCSGQTDTCESGSCKCGNRDACSEPDICTFGACSGRSFVFLR